jgi:hypothetical protein
MTDSDVEVFSNGSIWSTNQRWIGMRNGIVYDLSFRLGSKAIPPPEWMKMNQPRKHRVRNFGMVGPLIEPFETLFGFSLWRKSGANEFGGGFQKSVPVWPLFTICLVPAANRWRLMVMQWWLERRIRAAALEGVCYSCRYNLIGNKSGVCPECGRPIPYAALPNQLSMTATFDPQKT